MSKAKPFKLTAPRVTERVEQDALFQWAAVMTPKEPRLRLLNASLNGVRLSLHQAILAKKSGMKKGFPDISLPVAAHGWNGLYIELKRKDGVKSDVSKEQRQWLTDLEEQGYQAVVCFGWESAAWVIEEYLGMQEQATKNLSTAINSD
jgi:hypothetical protein